MNRLLEMRTENIESMLKFLWRVGIFKDKDYTDFSRRNMTVGTSEEADVLMEDIFGFLEDHARKKES